MKRWTVDIGDDGPELWWSVGRSDPGVSLARIPDFLEEEELADAHAALVEAVRDAGRLRGLAATFSSHLNANQTFTGAQIAAMLNSKAEVL